MHPDFATRYYSIIHLINVLLLIYNHLQIICTWLPIIMTLFIIFLD